MAIEYRLSHTAAQIDEKLHRIDNLASKNEIPKKISDLTNDSDFATETYVQGYAQPIGDYALLSDVSSFEESIEEAVSVKAEKTYVDKEIASVKSNIDTSIENLKNDLLNGAGEAYDTLKELGELIDDNHDAIDALEMAASSKADVDHMHTFEDINGLQDMIASVVDTKAEKTYVNEEIAKANSVQSNRIDTIEAKIIDGLEAVTSEEISALFL